MDLKKFILDNFISQLEFVIAELKAFGFTEDLNNRKYFNEKFYSLTYKIAGSKVLLQYPDIKNISGNDLLYFESRAKYG